MIIRIRTNVGQWRVSSVTPSSLGQDIVSELASTKGHTVIYTQPLSLDPAGHQPLDFKRSLQDQNLTHGSMIYCRVDPSSIAVGESTADGAAAGNHTTDDVMDSSSFSPTATETTGTKKPALKTKKRILPDGSISIEQIEGDADGDAKSFRKGMLPLRSMKMQWTLQEFMDMDNKFVFKIQQQKERWVGPGGVSLDQKSAQDFQAYLMTFAFQRQRFGYLYGKFIDQEPDPAEIEKRPKKETLFGTELPDTEIQYKAKNQMVLVEAIYEPPQEADPNSAEGFIALEDPMEDKVNQLASMLGLKRVGWIFGHPPREAGFQMSSAEVIMAAELQIEAADGVEETPFVTVKVTVGDDGNVSFEAFQVSQQCMEMVAEEALEVGENPGFCNVHETFTAIQEGKESRTVENNFFLTVVPIKQHSSEMLVSEFPKANRDHDVRQQTHDEMKKQLQKSGSAGWTFVDLLADFNLLIYLSKFLDVDTDLAKICKSIVDRDVPLEDGYKLIIASMAGLDGSY
jgi:Nuclear pore protein